MKNIFKSDYDGLDIVKNNNPPVTEIDISNMLHSCFIGGGKPDIELVASHQLAILKRYQKKVRESNG